MTPAPEIDVYYDGECPICRWEVDLYKRMDKAARINWSDITLMSASQLPVGKTREDLLGKFHAREAGEDTTWHIGVDAFARIWKALPGLRYIAFVFRLPIIRQLSMLAYRGFLRWQSWHRAHRRASKAGS